MKKNKKKTRSQLPDLSFLSGMFGLKKIHFERMPKNTTISLRMNESLLEAIKEKSEEEGLHYQKWIRKVIEDALEQKAFKREV